ncbi:MAG: thiamine phosphate synthase [Undibacterium sp.]|uniref:thiamine phosphate synthase n=1 Tax=Undibacterium sp. TaxID=1914977 RepID=UPI00272176C3|nr:thiamine phosphate synthase [Undibacterium sp.]MDO8651471.1 thiamine phosphate synthase [Undibacterium sp.]
MHTLAGLYLVTPDWDDTAQLIEVTEQALLGGAALVQYRHKFADAALRQQQASALLALCRRFNKPFIINDHLDLCLALDADGIHVGGTDASVATIRAAVGPDKIVGASCYGDMQLAQAAHLAGASYVAFGGFYPSRVKKYPVTTPFDIVSRACAALPLPNVVIGGMSAENCRPLVAAGAHMVAAISSVYLAEHPQAAARAFAQLLERRA